MVLPLAKMVATDYTDLHECFLPSAKKDLPQALKH